MTTEKASHVGASEDNSTPWDGMPSGKFGEYDFRENCIFTGSTLAANFQVHITAELVRMTSKGERRSLEVIGVHQDGSRYGPTEISWPEFRSLSFLERWGAACTIGAGHLKDKVRAAIQFASGQPPVRRIYTEPGFAIQDDRLAFYVHNGGAIGTIGTIPDVLSELPEECQHVDFSGTTGASPEDEIRAIRASLSMIEMAPDRISFPLAGATYLGVLASVAKPDFLLHLWGDTGARKTSMACIALAHYTRSHPEPGVLAAFASTVAANEFILAANRDAVVVLDDLVPTGSRFEDERIAAESSRILRSVGNLKGRDRGTRDLSVKRGAASRGLIIGTGEDIPPGVESAVARSFLVHVQKGDVRLAELSRLQGLATDGTLALAMASFIKHILLKQDEFKLRLLPRVNQHARELNEADLHPRTPFQYGRLLAAFESFSAFALERNAITPSEAETLLKRAKSGLREATALQADALAEGRAGARTLQVFRSSLVARRAYIDGFDGQPPCDPGKFGWIQRAGAADASATTYWMPPPQGERLGRTDNEYVWLDKVRAHLHVQRVLAQAGETGVGTANRWTRALKREGLLADMEKGRCTVRLPRSAVREPALKMHVAVLFGMDDLPGRDLDEPRMEDSE